MAETTDWNAGIITEFRENEGKVGGQFEGSPLLLLHSTGAKSGKERVHPVMYDRRGDDFVVFASKAGAPTNPDWYHNLLANPAASIEVGTEVVEVVARVADEGEREAIWGPWKTRFEGFAGYEQNTSRQIPVVILEPSPRATP